MIGQTETWPPTVRDTLPSQHFFRSVFWLKKPKWSEIFCRPSFRHRGGQRPQHFLKWTKRVDESWRKDVVIGGENEWYERWICNPPLWQCFISPSFLVGDLHLQKWLSFHCHGSFPGGYNIYIYVCMSYEIYGVCSIALLRDPYLSHPQISFNCRGRSEESCWKQVETREPFPKPVKLFWL